MKNLILYGPQNLTNKKCGVEGIQNFRGNSSSIQSIRNARFAGSTVVDKKYNDKTALLTGVIRATEYLTFEEVLNEYSRALAKEDRYLRVTTNYVVFTDLLDETGWQIQGDTTELSFDTDTFQYSDGSVKFNSDVSEANSYSGIYTETATEQDISSYGNNGAFEAWVYLPQTEGVTNVELKIGNDTSNYYSDTVTDQYDGTLFEAGWNYLSFTVEEMSVTGTIDPYGFGSYISIKINYDGLMEDRDNFRIGGVLWQEEERTRNFKSYVKDFDVSAEHYDITRANFNLTVYLYEGVAESTTTYDVLGVTGQTAATYSGEIELEGTYNPLPIFTIDITAATNVSGITLTNVTTGDSVAITRTYTAGERLLINMDDREVLVNGIPTDYDDVLPRFILGENDVQLSITSTGLETIDELTQNSNLTGEV